MAYNDLRQFIERLEKTGDLVRIKYEVDWNMEAGAIMRRCNEIMGPAQLFEKIKDYPKGYRLMGSPLSTFRRVAIAMEMAPDSSYAAILDEFISRSKNPIKPVLLTSGPCKENVLKGDDVDLFKFPVPMIHGWDGSRTIGSWNVGICKDPESDWVNWGMYRMMVHDKNTTGAAIVPSQHIGMMYAKYEKMGKPMPYVVTVGTEPVCSFLATTGIPYGVCESDIVGGIRREPIELVKCETVNLYVPATAEIVLEGEVLPKIRMEEGPFGEYPGYQASGRVPRPIFKVKAITFRNDPILTVSCIGTPVDDFHVAGNIGITAELKMLLLQLGIPITGIYLPPECAFHLIVVAANTPYAEIAKRIASCIWSHKNGQFIPRVIVVNDDVDPSNMQEVLHAFATKCHPIRGTHSVERSPTSPLTGFLSPQEKTPEYGIGANVLYDCTWPIDWPPDAIPRRSSFHDIYPEEVKEKVLSKWKTYGFA